MAGKKCSHLVETGHANQGDHYTCDITEKLCVASTFDNPDPGHPASCEFAEYHPHLAALCPGYNVDNSLVKKIREYWKK